MAGLPPGAWALLFLAVGLGLTLELIFYWARIRERRGEPGGTEGTPPPEVGP